MSGVGMRPKPSSSGVRARSRFYLVAVILTLALLVIAGMAGILLFVHGGNDVMPRPFNASVTDGLAEKVLFNDFWPKESIANVTVIVEVVELAPDHLNTSFGNGPLAENGTTCRFTSLGRSTGELVRNGSASMGELSSVAYEDRNGNSVIDAGDYLILYFSSFPAGKHHITITITGSSLGDETYFIW